MNRFEIAIGKEPPELEPENGSTISSTGVALDGYGSYFGLYRFLHETDVEFKKRIERSIRNG